jgi:hypothetical protein
MIVMPKAGACSVTVTAYRDKDRGTPILTADGKTDLVIPTLCPPAS